MNQHEEAGRELREEEEIEEEPSLGRGGGGREEPEDMLAPALSPSHRVEHLTVAPVTPALVITAQLLSIDSLCKTFGSRNNYKSMTGIVSMRT